MAPSTDRRAGSQALNWVGEAELPPDTVRDRAAGGTLPLAIVTATETAPLPALDTLPLAEPVRVATAPIALPKHAPLTYEVYTPDDTLRGKPVIPIDLADDARPVPPLAPIPTTKAPRRRLPPRPGAKR